MITKPITIQNMLGLHTRAAAKLAALASQFDSQIQFAHNNQTADCKSIMSLVLLGVKKGAVLDLTVFGPDEVQACDAVVALINNKFDES
jgi:phosphocarrier protein HPr